MSLVKFMNFTPVYNMYQFYCICTGFEQSTSCPSLKLACGLVQAVVLSQGDQGDQGPLGDVGEVGPQGNQGPQVRVKRVGKVWHIHATLYTWMN